MTLNKFTIWGIIISGSLCIYVVVISKPVFLLFFDGKFVYWSAFLLMALFFPQLWFTYWDPKYKDEIEKIKNGDGCKDCEKKYNNFCIGVNNGDEPIIKKKINDECEKLKKFAVFLGFMERALYFVVLIFFGFSSQFFAIVGAWVTLKAAGGDFWKQGVEKGIGVHCKRARYLLFLINNFISIGAVIIVFLVAQRFVFISEGVNFCSYWC